MRIEYTRSQIRTLGLDIFDSEASFNQWLENPIPALNGQPPNALLSSLDGRKQVWLAMLAIKHGDLS